MKKPRTLAAWTKGGKFYLSAFRGEQAFCRTKDDPGRTPAREFATRAELEAEAARRKVNVDWEYEGDGERKSDGN